MGADARGEIEALVEDFPARAPGSDAERRAARHLGTRLEERGREVELEGFDAWPRWPLALAINAALAIVGSVLAVSMPIAGAVLVLVATTLTFLEAIGVAPLTRRLLGRRASQNVVSRADADKPGAVVLVAHYDAGRQGAIFGRSLEERRASLGRLIRRPIGRLEPLLWAQLLVLACAILRIPGLDNVALTAVQFVPTVALILALPLLLDVELSATSPGAGDNASGVAAALELADRHAGKLEHFGVWLLFTGAQESLSDGMRAFLRRHRKALDRSRTVFVNLDEVGSGTVRYTRREGPLAAARSHVQLVGLCDEIAEDDEDGAAFGARPLVNRTMSDGAVARGAGYPAVTLSCRNALDYVPTHHQATDTPDRIDDEAVDRALGFAGELLERLDSEIGPDLRRGGPETALSESD